MISLSSLHASIELPATDARKDGATSSEGNETGGNDGFSLLMAQLDQLAAPLVVASADSVTKGEAASAETLTGKILPAGRQDLAGSSPQGGSGSVGAQQAPGLNVVALGDVLSGHGVEGRLHARPEHSGDPAKPIASPRANIDPVVKDAAQQSHVSQSAKTIDALVPAPGVRNLGPSGGPQAQPQQITIAVASSPVAKGKNSSSPGDAAAARVVGSTKAAGRDSHSQAVSATLTAGSKAHPAAMQDGTSPARPAIVQSNAEGSPISASQARDAGEISRAAEQTVRGPEARLATGDKDAAQPERVRKASLIEAVGSKTGHGETVKSFASPMTTAIEPSASDRQVAARPASAVAPQPLTSAEGIEKLVDRLAMARDFDVSKPATIALAHREFGALNVTFENTRSGLEVEIAAKDAEMQRALAGALAADRQATRGTDVQAQPQSHSQASQHAAPGSERGGTSTGHGSNHADSGAQGERSQHQRGNPARPALDDRFARNSAPTGDDALYA